MPVLRQPAAYDEVECALADVESAGGESLARLREARGEPLLHSGEVAQAISVAQLGKAFKMR
jgi:hypothetical protein